MIDTTKTYANSLSEALSGVDNITDPVGGFTIEGFMSSIIAFAVPLSVFSVFVLLVFAAYRLMTSQGNPDKLKEAQEVITNAIVGFLFILLSVVILLLISNLFGITRIGGN